MDTKLQESIDLKAKLEKNQINFAIQIKAAELTLGTALAKQKLGLLSRSAVDASRDSLAKLQTRRDEEALQLLAMPAILEELKQPDTNARGPNRHEQIQKAQADYKRLWSKLNIRANSTGKHVVNSGVVETFQQLLAAGKILKNTNKIGDLAEVWQLLVERDVYGGCTSIDARGEVSKVLVQKTAPAKPPPWQPMPLKSFAKRVNLSEKRVLQLFTTFQEPSGSLIPWSGMSRSKFHQWQDWLEAGEYVKEDFRPPGQKELADEVNISEKSLRNYFVRFKGEKGLANGYLHMSQKTYQLFREYLETAPARAGVVR